VGVGWSGVGVASIVGAGDGVGADVAQPESRSSPIPISIPIIFFTFDLLYLISDFGF
jgi:hypothetical protein